MAFNPLAGISGSVKIGTVAFAFSKWAAVIECTILPASNFTSGGYQQVVAGMLKASITLEQQAYDEGNTPFTAGNSYTLILGYTMSITLTLTILVATIEPTVEYEGSQSIKITGKSNGSFTAGIL